MSANGGASLQQAYENGGATVATLGADIANGASAAQIQSNVAEIYSPIVGSVASETATTTAMQVYAATIAGANALAADIVNARSGKFAADANYIAYYANGADNPSQTINWSSFEATDRPAFVDQTDWNNIWTQFEGIVGNSTGSFATALAQAATELSQIGQPTNDVSRLMSYLLLQADGTQANNYIASSTDLSGPSLSLGLAYNASLATRDNPGLFGDGWTSTYDISAITDASGNVYIKSPNGVEVFTSLSNGRFVAQPGDSATLSATSTGGYRLVDSRGTVTGFNSNGTLSQITDANGNTTNVNWSVNGDLQSISSSTGEIIAFTTNSFGRIASATDSGGQQVTYTYNSTGTQLVSVSGADGVTSYAYNGVTGSVNDNALTEVTNLTARITISRITRKVCLPRSKAIMEPG